MRLSNIKTKTFWLGVLCIAIGIAIMLGAGTPEVQQQLGVVGTILAALLGTTDPSPLSLIIIGAGLVTGRDAIEKVRKEVAVSNSRTKLLDQWDIEGLPGKRND